MKKFSETSTNKETKARSYKKYVGIAAAAMLTFGAVGTIPSMATSNETMYKIATFLGIEKNLSSYETIVGQAVTEDGITMAINEVILNNDKLIVSVTTQLDGINEADFTGPLGRVYINGKEINNAATAETKILEDGTGLTLITFELDEAPQGEIDVKVQLTTPVTNVSRSSHWNFEFRTNGTALQAETQVINIDQTYTMEDGTTVTVNHYEANQLGERIVYTGEVGRDSSIEVKGVDEKGNPVHFIASGVFNGTGELVIAQEDKAVLEEATCLTLAVYENDKQLGETFEITK